MALQLKYEFDRESAKEVWRSIRGTMAGALRVTMTDLAKRVQEQGRAEIARSGLTSTRWRRGFRTFVFPRIPQGQSLDMQLRGRHQIGFANIFERGGVIRGRPLLWVPLSSAPARINGKRTTARGMIDAGIRLFKIERPGRPPLLAGYTARGARGRVSVGQLRAGQRNARRRQARSAFGGRLGRGPVAVPLFVGLSSTRIRDRMNVSAVYDRARRDLPRLYADNVKRGR